MRSYVDRKISSTANSYRGKNALKRTAQGAAVGTAIAPGIGTAIGAGVGLVASLFENDPEEELKRRRDAMIASINNERAKRIAAISQESSNARQSNAQGAMARAIDTGRDPSNIEDSLLVANQQNAQAANQALNQADQYFNDQVLQVEGEYNSRPLEVPLSETLMDAGTNAIAGYYQNKSSERSDQYLKSLTDMNTAQTDVLKKQLGGSGVTTGITAKVGTVNNTDGILSNDFTQQIPKPFTGIVNNEDIKKSSDLSRYAKASRVARMTPQGNLMSRKKY